MPSIRNLHVSSGPFQDFVFYFIYSGQDFNKQSLMAKISQVNIINRMNKFPMLKS